MRTPHESLAAFLLALACIAAATAASAGPDTPTVATVDEIKAYYRAQKKTVVTFVGYSGAGYEQPERMLSEAAAALDGFAPAATIVNIGGTPDGIGAVYDLAKRRGFATTGIVSTQARAQKVPLSAAVDRVFYVEDKSWGGVDPATGRLSATSQAMVEVSDVVIGIGGGDVARDELAAGRRMNRDVRFVAADMNRQKAIDAASRRGLSPPTDFRGSAHALFMP